MRGLALPFMLATVLAAGPVTLVAMAQPVQVAPQVAAETPFRQTFEQDARARLRVWEVEIAALDKAAEAKGRRQGDAAGVELDAAWDDAKVQEKHLEVASTAEWETARTMFSQSSRRLEDALEKVHSRVD